MVKKLEKIVITVLSGVVIIAVFAVAYWYYERSKKIDHCVRFDNGCWDRLQNTCVIGRDRRTDDPNYCAVEKFVK